MIPVHLFLIGMAGSGKTSLGMKLAGQLDLPFLDTDQRVGEMMGMAPEDICARFGEDFFHNAETGVLIELVDEPPCIVSTGGGLPLVKENVQLMQNHDIIILIDRPLDQILSDMHSEAKAGQGGGHEDVIQEYNQRIGFYRACADYTFNNDHGLLVGSQGLAALVGEIFAPQLQ